VEPAFSGLRTSPSGRGHGLRSAGELLNISEGLRHPFIASFVPVERAIGPTRCTSPRLLALAGLSSLSGEVTVIECLSNHCFDHGLSADVQFPGNLIQFTEDWFGKIEVDLLNRGHHPAAVGKKLRNVLASFGLPGN
jgi:hypothetical protein